MEFSNLLQIKLILTNLRKYLHQYTKTFEINIKPEHFYILFALYVIPNISQEKISFYFGFDRATTGRTLDRLEKQGILIRTVNPSDNRAKEITLTPKGMEICQDVEVKIKDWFSEITNENDIKNMNMDETLRLFTDFVANQFKDSALVDQKDIDIINEK